MRVFKQLLITICCSSAVLLVSGIAIGQTGPDRATNNPYSPSPTATSLAAVSPLRSDTRQDASDAAKDRNNVTANRRSQLPIQPRPAEDTRTTVGRSAHPSTVYRIGVNDVLRINLLNASGGLRYVKVGADGRIEFPPAPGSIYVLGKTTELVTRELQDSIKLFADPKVSVEVREYASHIVSIEGLVDQPGGQQIQRDAVPFFVIRAGVTPDRRAGAVRITRNGTNIVENYALSDHDLASVFVYPGDRVDFLERPILHND